MSGEHINAAGLALIKRFEGMKLEAYQDGVGIWTIGYGHTLGVKPGDTTTESAAEIELRHDVRRAEEAVSTAVHTGLNPNQFSACVSLAFNIGGDRFSHSSLCRLLNDGEHEQAANEFHKWNHAGGKVVDGLTRRRQAEEELFRKPMPKPLSESRTMKAQGIAATATVTAGALQEYQDILSGLVPYLDIAKYALLAVVIGSIVWTVFARWDDHRRSLR